MTKIKILLAAVTCAAVAALSLMPATSQAAPIPGTTCMTVVADTVRVRPTEGNPNYIGVLKYGDTFAMQSYNGGAYAYGFAYGTSTNSWGWVDRSAITPCGGTGSFGDEFTP